MRVNAQEGDGDFVGETRRMWEEIMPEKKVYFGTAMIHESAMDSSEPHLGEGIASSTLPRDGRTIWTRRLE